jgi:hypothetical protein
MICPHCGEVFDATKAQIGVLERPRLKRELYEQEQREAYESMKDKPRLAVDTHGIYVKGQRLVGRFGAFLWIAAFLAFLLTDDIKWHAVVVPLVFLAYAASTALNYINYRDHVKWVEEHPEAVDYLSPPSFER